MKKARYIVPVLALIAGTSCGYKADKGEAQPKESQAVNTVSFSVAQQNAAGLAVATPREQMTGGVITLQGKIEVPPQSMVSVSFPLGGYLRATKMLPGTQVRKGQVLAELEDMQFIQLQQDYLMAKERFLLAESEYKRQYDLNTSKASSDKVYQQSRTEMETQRILVNALARKLELIGIAPGRLRADNITRSVVVVSPIDGFVSKVNVNTGKYTAPADMLFELVDPHDIHLMLHVFEKDLALLSIGQSVQAYTNNAPDKKISAKIILVSRNLDENRMAEVHCHFQGSDPALVPGMFMNGEVAIAAHKALTVPEEAIVRWQNKFYVFTQTASSTFVMTPVTAGTIVDGWQQIQAEGITADTKIVSKNAYTILMKMKNTEEE